MSTVRRNEFARRTGTITLPPDDPRHGTANGYNNYRCRCDPCRDAWAIYYRAKNYRRSKQTAAEYAAERRDPSRLVHNESGYSRGCRCDICRTASNEARARRRKNANPAQHGSVGYRNGCRCDVCRSAYNAWHWVRRTA